MPELHPSASNVHLSAVEHKDSIVFLHAVQAGPASQSYGLQVAQLAGVPTAVIRAARKHLAALEAQSVQSTPQFDLFNAPERAQDSDVHAVANTTAVASDPFGQAVVDALAEIDPDALTPRQALDALYRLKQLDQGA
jgi:DNA mismatch repair protein MutS